MLFGIDSVFLIDLALRFAINIGAMSLLLFGMYYPRYRDKETVTAASLFNIFVFAVLVVLSSVEFSIAAGFGLFAILALFTLRSEQITKTEITYFFGSVSIAVINAVMGTTLPFVLFISLLVLAGAYVLDHPSLLKAEDRMKVTLEEIPAHVLSDPARMRKELSERLGVDILSYRILGIDYITEMVRVDVNYRKLL